MLELAAAQALGAHPYFVPVEHTAFAREVLGDGPMLCPSRPWCSPPTPSEARAAARLHMATYLTLPNYTNNLRRLGWGDDDLGDGGSDKLVDAIVAWGDEDGDRRLACRPTSTPGPTTCACRCCGNDATALPMEEWRAPGGTASIALTLRH